jgi:hypothetical protein
MRRASPAFGAWLALAAVLVGVVGVAHAAPEKGPARKTRNVVLIVSDGLRWQEVFTGADPGLMNEEAGGSWTPIPELRAAYWSDDPAERRAKLFPFLWGTLATQGQLFGNQTKGSVAHVTNPMWFSYPGYNEMTTGAADPKIDSNEFGPNPNVTVFEWLNAKPAYRGQVEIFGTWSVFHDIFNEDRSHLPIRSGTTLVDAGDASDSGRLLEQLYATTTRLEFEDPYDSFLSVALRRHLEKHHPRVLFVGFGDTDNFAHLGHYDMVLNAAHNFDGFLGALWREMQAIPAYRDKTTFIVTADHGRGSGPEDWKEHGVDQKGSQNIWIGVLGPDTPPLGERHDVPPVTQAQIAATVAAALGEDYAAAKPGVAAALPDVLPAP